MLRSSASRLGPARTFSTLSIFPHSTRTITQTPHTTSCLTLLTRKQTPLNKLQKFSQHVRHITVDRLPEPRERIPITFIDQDGRRYTVDAAVGDTLLQVVREFDLPMPMNCEGGGLGGNKFDFQATCEFCHVYIDDEHIGMLPAKNKWEEVNTYWIPKATRNSRFACEVFVTKEMSGMTVVLADYGKLGRDRSWFVGYPS